MLSVEDINNQEEEGMSFNEKINGFEAIYHFTLKIYQDKTTTIQNFIVADVLIVSIHEKP